MNNEMLQLQTRLMMTRYNIDVGLLDTSEGSLVAACKLHQRKLNTDVMGRFVAENNGTIGQHFIPPEYFDAKAADEFDEFIFTLAYGWYYGGVRLIGDKMLFKSMLETDSLDEVPTDWVNKIPGWTVSIKFRFSGSENPEKEFDIDIFMARRFVDGKDSLIVAEHFPDEVVRWNVIGLEPTDGGFVKLAAGEEVTELTRRIVAAMLFSYSLIPHHPTEVTYPARKKKTGTPDYIIQPKSKPSVVDITKWQTNYLDDIGVGSEGIHQSHRKAHMRCAHWRSVWLGPRDGEQRKELRWIPPTFVRGFKAE